MPCSFKTGTVFAVFMSTLDYEQFYCSMFPKCYCLLFYARFSSWTVAILLLQQYFLIFKTVIWSWGFCFCIMWAHQSKFLLLKWWQIIGSWSGEKCNMQYRNEFLISIGYNRSKVVTVKKWSSCKTDPHTTHTRPWHKLVILTLIQLIEQTQ